MAKEICASCDAKLPAPVSFCPSCEHPTRYASDPERLDWDLKQWRSHVDRSVARGMNPTGAAVGFGDGGSVAVAQHAQPEVPVTPDAKPRSVPMPAPQSRFLRLYRTSAPAEPVIQGAPESPAAQPMVEAANVEARKPAREPKPKKIRFKRAERTRPETPPAMERDRDNEFAYQRCATCNEDDWIVRYGRNEDETYKYWCIRCSRSFKTELKLRQAIKPLFSSGVVIGGLIVASLLLR